MSDMIVFFEWIMASVGIVSVLAFTFLVGMSYERARIVKCIKRGEPFTLETSDTCIRLQAAKPEADNSHAE